MKNNAIFNTTEVLNYVADAIHENLSVSKDPVDYGYWTLAFNNVFGDLKLRELTKKEDNIVELYNFLILSRNKKDHRYILKNIFKRITAFEKQGLIENADLFTGSMVAWVLDPARSYYTDSERRKAIEEVNLILNRKGWIIKYRDVFKKNVFEQQKNITPIDKDALYFYGDRLFIAEGKLYFKKPNDTTETIKTKPTDLKILEHLIGMGKGNIDNWLKTVDLSDRLDLNVRTVSNSISAIRKISVTVGISLIEDRGPDVKGKEFRINPKVL